MTISNHFKKLARLYEQDACPQRIGQYVEVWWRWANAGIATFIYPQICLLDVIIHPAERCGADAHADFLKHAIQRPIMMRQAIFR